MAAGDIVNEALLVIKKVTVKSNEDIEKGEVIYQDGNEFLAAPNTVTAAKLYVALEAHDYSEVDEHDIRAALFGCIVVQKKSGNAIKEGQLVMISSTAGEVDLYVKGDAPTGGISTYYTTTIESGVQDAIDEWEIVLGTCAKNAGANDTTVEVWVGVK
jgi:hypothetical protein